jgi:hypothetical protein
MKNIYRLKLGDIGVAEKILTDGKHIFRDGLAVSAMGIDLKMLHDNSVCSTSGYTWSLFPFKRTFKNEIKKI